MSENNKQLDYLIILPCFNEAKVLEKTINTLLSMKLELNKKGSWKIVIADNASNDNTQEIAKQLESSLEGKVLYYKVQEKGRGNCLSSVIKTIKAKYYLYVDADLPIKVEEILNFFTPLESGEADIVNGQRNGERSLFRKILTFGLRIINFLLFDLMLCDWQCGIKSFNKKVAEEVLVNCKEKGYFLDTELLVKSNLLGLKIKQIPINWVEQRYKNRKSKVCFLQDSFKCLFSVCKIWKDCYAPKLATLFPAWFFLLLMTVLVFWVNIFFIRSIDPASLYIIIPGKITPNQQVVKTYLLVMLLLYSCFSVMVIKLKNFDAKLFFKGSLIFFGIIAFTSLISPTNSSQDLNWNLLLTKGFTHYHLNPYITPANFFKADSWYKIGWWDKLPMVQGPLWVLFLSIATFCTSSFYTAVFVVKFLFLISLIFSGIVLWKIMDKHNLSLENKTKRFVLVIFSPIVIQNALTDAHSDVLVMMFILTSYLLLQNKKFISSILVLVSAGLIKYFPFMLVLIPVKGLIQSKGWKKGFQSLAIAGLLGSLLTAILCSPFLTSNLKSLLGIRSQLTVIRGDHLTESSLLSSFIYSTFAISVQNQYLLAITISIVVLISLLKQKKIYYSYVYPIISLLLLSPLINSWYLLWFFPLFSVFGFESLIILVGTLGTFSI